MIAEGIERGGRNGVDGIGADEIIDINGIRVGGIVRARRSPKRTLRTGAETSLERCKTRRRKKFFKGMIGKFCICNRGLAKQV